MTPFGSDLMPARFWSKVRRVGDCWVWNKAPGAVGRYGSFWWRGKTVGAHVAAYEGMVGPVPDGCHVDHHCHNPLCVRPDHLFAATVAQNGENRRGANANSLSGVRGVVWNEARGKWVVYVRHQRKTVYGGCYDTTDAADSAAVALRNDLHSNNVLDRVKVRP